MIAKIIKWIIKNLWSILSTVILVVTAYFIYHQAQIAKEATIPNLVVSVFNDEERKGLYITNFGKGHAIVDSIQISTMNHKPITKESITKEIWNSTLKNLGVNGEVDCFAWSPIQKNIVVRAGETNILLGKRQGIWNELQNNKKFLQEQTEIMRINLLNQLVLQHISNSKDMVNGRDIVSEYIDRVSAINELQKDESNKCEKIDKQFRENGSEEIIKKLDNIKITIFYHSIINDEPIKSKRLQFYTTINN